jgi:hypothetical protein
MTSVKVRRFFGVDLSNEKLHLASRAEALRSREGLFAYIFFSSRGARKYSILLAVCLLVKLVEQRIQVDCPEVPVKLIIFSRSKSHGTMGHKLAAVFAVLVRPQLPRLPGTDADIFILPEPGNRERCREHKAQPHCQRPGQRRRGAFVPGYALSGAGLSRQTPLITGQTGIKVMAAHPELHAAYGLYVVFKAQSGKIKQAVLLFMSVSASVPIFLFPASSTSFSTGMVP